MLVSPRATIRRGYTFGTSVRGQQSAAQVPFRATAASGGAARSVRASSPDGRRHALPALEGAREVRRFRIAEHPAYGRVRALALRPACGGLRFAASPRPGFRTPAKRREASLKTAGRKPECGGDVSERQSACQGCGRECPQKGRDERRVFKSCVLCLQDHCFDLPANLTKRIGKRKVRGVEGNRDGVARAKRHFGAKPILVPAGGHLGSVRKLDMHRQVRDTRHPAHRPEDEGGDNLRSSRGRLRHFRHDSGGQANPLSVRYKSVVEAPCKDGMCRICAARPSPRVRPIPSARPAGPRRQDRPQRQDRAPAPRRPPFVQAAQAVS